ncbi:MAG: hypothetical protein ACRC7N_21865 [Clostridium sp.]
MNCLTLLPSSKSLLDKSSCGCSGSQLASTNYSSLLISFKMDPYYTENKTLSQCYLIFKNQKNSIIPLCGLNIDCTLNKTNGESKTVNINNPEVSKQGCYLSINCTEAFSEDDFDNCENISWMIYSKAFTNNDYCALLNMGVVCRLGFEEAQEPAIYDDPLQGRGINEMRTALEELVGQRVSVTTTDSPLNEYDGRLAPITCPYCITLNNEDFQEIIPINKITAINSPKISCVDLPSVLNSPCKKDCCFTEILESLKCERVRIQLQGLGCESNSFPCTIKEVYPGVTKCQSNCENYLINNYQISRIMVDTSYEEEEEECEPRRRDTSCRRGTSRRENSSQGRRSDGDDFYQSSSNCSRCNRDNRDNRGF